MTIRHPEKVNQPINPIKKKPYWIRSKLTNSKEFFLTKTIVNQNNLITVCQEANCPNITECWSKRHATFMIMGDTCTRACAFCDVKTGKPVKLDEDGEVSKEYKKFAEHLKDNEWNVGTGENICANKSEYKRADDINSLYEDENKDAPTNKENKWKEIFGSDRYLKCKSKKDIKNVKVFQICRWNHCDYKNESVYDDGLFIGRVQINMNGGKKRRFLYFTADYQLKK